MASTLGNIIARESKRSIDQFGHFSDAQLRKLQRLYLDSRLRINGIVAENWGSWAKAPADGFTAMRLRNMQTQIDAEIASLSLKLNQEIPGMINTAGEMGIRTGQGELARVLNKFPEIRPSFTVINRAAIEVYSDYALQLSKQYTAEMGRKIQSALRQGVIEQQSVQQLTTKIRGIMGADYGKPAKAITYNAQRVARTEMTRAYAAGHQAYGKSIDFIVGEKWHTNSIGRWPCAECEIYDGIPYFYKDGDPPNIPVHPMCYSDDTEVYTDRGWMLFKDLKGKEQILSLNPKTFDLEWLPYIREVSYYFKGQLYHLKNKWFSLKVTPNHQQLFGTRSDPVNRKKIKWQIGSIEDMVLRSEFRIPKVAKWKGKDPEFININGLSIKSEDFCRFMGYYLSEGSVGVRGENNYQMSIAQGSKEGIDKIYEDILGMPVKFCKGKEHIYCSSKSLAKYLLKFGKSAQKFVPDEIKELSPKFIEIFLLAYNYGDGSSRMTHWKEKQIVSREYTFSTSSPKMASDLGELILRAGGYPSYYIDRVAGKLQKFKNGIFRIKNDQHKIAWNRSKTACFEKNDGNIDLVDYDGYVYDVELPRNHILWVKHDGKTCFSGNCRCYTTYLYKKEMFTKEELTKLGGIIKGPAETIPVFTPAPTKAAAEAFARKMLLNKGGAVNYGRIPLRNVNLINEELDRMVRAYKTKLNFIGSKPGYSKFAVEKGLKDWPMTKSTFADAGVWIEGGSKRNPYIRFSSGYWNDSKLAHLRDALLRSKDVNWFKTASIPKTVWHEYGHTLQQVGRMDMKPFNAAYIAAKGDEISRVAGTFATTSIREGWAEFFALYQKKQLPEKWVKIVQAVLETL